jgi:hypothetical protein
MSSHDPTDPAVAALREAIALESVPPEVIAAARASFSWRTIDAELAALSFDSRDAADLVGARSAGGPRSLSFEYGALSIEVEVPERSSTSLTIEGQVAPGEPAVVEVHHADHLDSFVAELRGNGRFSVAGVPSGAIRLMVRFAVGAGPAMLLTEWVTV